jgi:3-isopropylmalate dehydrogenase
VRTHARIAVIGGDGIGPEVVAEGLKVLHAAVAADGVKVETTDYDLLGAVGDPTVPSGILERGLLLKLRFAFEHAVNLRPVKLYPGVVTPLAGISASDVDMVVVREGTEGPYVGVGGALRHGTAHEIATEASVNTRYGVERVVRDAFSRSAARPRRHLTLVHKTNVLTHAGSLWLRTVEAVNADFPDVTVDYAHVDAACLYLVSQPQRFDVVVTDNLFGDIITDLGAAIAGGIGLAASGNLNVDGSAPSMFEPVHGSAPDIAGEGVADPTATILSVAMLLDALSLHDAAARVESAVAADLAERGDAPRGTGAVGDAIAAGLA